MDVGLSQVTSHSPVVWMWSAGLWCEVSSSLPSEDTLFRARLRKQRKFGTAFPRLPILPLDEYRAEGLWGSEPTQVSTVSGVSLLSHLGSQVKPT